MSPPKQICLLTYGTRGDVQPFIALGRGLSRAGYSVRLVAPARDARLAEGHGLSFAGLPGDPDQLARMLAAQAGLSLVRQVRRMSDFVLPIAVEVLHAAQLACSHSHAIVHSFLMTDAGHLIAAQIGIPDVSAQFFPVFSTTSSFPGVTFPDLPLGPAYRRLTHRLTTAVFRYGGRLLYAWLRRTHPDLPPLASWPFGAGAERPAPILYAFSPHVVPRPCDWPETSVITGYWFLDEPSSFRPSPGLEGFLAAGEPPVYVSFGSMQIGGGQDRLRLCLEALEILGLRGVISLGHRHSAIDLSPRHFATGDDLPHAWLFPRLGAVVHHGGAGTTGAALRAGVPQLILPVSADQGFWGRRVEQLGVGPRPILQRQLGAGRLQGALRLATQDAGMQANARALGDAIRCEDGVGSAVAFLRGYLGPPSD
jgi:sterol 3beta-glucosyltransferase